MNSIFQKNKIAGYIMFLFVFLANLLSAQEVEMADAMHTSGKIYVVVAVLSIVFAGIVVYLVSLDRKISKLEKQAEDKK